MTDRPSQRRTEDLRAASPWAEPARRRNDEPAETDEAPETRTAKSRQYQDALRRHADPSSGGSDERAVNTTQPEPDKDIGLFGTLPPYQDDRWAGESDPPLNRPDE